jgi:hypothetical protein
VKSRTDQSLSVLGLVALTLIVATCKGDAGAAGPAGAAGAAGPTGPSNTTQVLNTGNLSISLTCGTRTVLTTMALTGPATYLITASGFLFSSGGTQVHVSIDFFRDAAQLAHGEVGSIVNVTGFVPASYSWSRLVNVAGATSTFEVRACRLGGDGTPVTFTNSLNATQIGTGTGAQSIEMGGLGPAGSR